MACGKFDNYYVLDITLGKEGQLVLRRFFIIFQMH